MAFACVPFKMEFIPIQVTKSKWFIRIAWILLIIIFIAAVTIRVHLALKCKALPDYSDMKNYNELAVKGGFDTYLAPLYPLFLRSVYSIFGDYNYRAVFVVQGVINSLIVILIFGIVTRLNNLASGLIAAAICCVYPNFVAYNLTTMTESLSLFIVVLFMWVLLQTFNEKYKAIILAFMLCAGSLIKPAILFFIPGTFFVCKKRLIFLISVIALLSPWIVRNSIVHHKVAPVSDTGALNFYASYNPAASGSKHVYAKDTPLKTYDHDQLTYVREGLKFIINNRWDTARIIYNKITVLFTRGWDSFVLKKIVSKKKNYENMLLYAYLPVMFFGFIGIVKFYSSQNRIILFPMFSYLLLAILLVIFKFRYRLLIEPVLIIYTSILIGNGFKSPVPQRSGGSS